MGLSQSLFSAISGLVNHQSRLDNIGNNLANINTTAYKRSVMNFADVLSQTIRAGSAPQGTFGGTNAIQIGLGMQIASVNQDFGQGGLQTTGKPSDVAIEGDGFFKMVFGNEVRYTRDGTFTLGQAGDLQNAFGYRVQGWMADDDGNIDVAAETENLYIELGERRLARATSNVVFSGNVNSAGDVATVNTAATNDSNNVLRSSELWLDAAGTIPATGASAISGIYVNGALLFSGLAAGDTVTIGAVKGNRNVSEDITVTAGTTLNTLMTSIQQALGIQTTEAFTGVSLLAGAGAGGGNVVRVAGNAGELNGISSLSLTHNGSSQNIFTETAAANGESAVTTTAVYDSLGNAHMVTLTLALVNRTSTNSTWRWYADCQDDTDLNLAVGTGTVVFDTYGQFFSDSGATISIDLTNQGVNTALVFDPDFSLMTQFAVSTGSEVNVRSQDGSPMGTLTSYSIGDDGIISGLFSNGLLQDLGQLCVTRFANNNGLLRDAQSLFTTSPNSGLAQDGVALIDSRGAIRAGSLESSNVDIAKEFTDMIMTQRGFQANARTITTSDEMLVELINLTR